MDNAVLIDSQDFKKLDFGYSHPMRGDRYEKALAEFKKMNLLGNLTANPDTYSQFRDDEEFISNVKQLSVLIRGFTPEVLILQTGVDGSKECAISNMKLARNSYDFVSNLIMDLQNKYGFKTLVLGGGGFVHPMQGQNRGIQVKNFIRK